jgi:hypothetical protein
MANGSWLMANGSWSMVEAFADSATFGDSIQ